LGPRAALDRMTEMAKIITADSAIQSATNALLRFYPEAHGARLEEIELVDGGPVCWQVTISFSDPTRPQNGNVDGMVGHVLANSITAALAVRNAREFKTFMIDAESGELRGMRMRNV
jgi:hypothetical protein